MPDCDSPRCHEKMTIELGKKADLTGLNAVRKCAEAKVPKKTLWVVCWAILVVIGIPLFVTGVGVWSQQESDELRYASKAEVEQCKSNQVEFRTVQRHIKQDLEELKEGQKRLNEGIADIQKYLRDH